jgi:hypothetical protein
MPFSKYNTAALKRPWPIGPRPSPVQRTARLCVICPYWPQGAAHGTGLPRPRPAGTLVCTPAANGGRMILVNTCNCLVCRFSSAVEQRFCKPKVGSSILSTGTTS